MQTAKFDLGLVKSLVKQWMSGTEVGYFSAVRCSIEYVIHVLSCTNVEAERIIFNGILQLETRSFSKRVFMWGEVADEYGLENYEGHNWYIKFMLDDDRCLEEISFHPCEKDMQLANGLILAQSICEEDKPHWRKGD